MFWRFGFSRDALVGDFEVGFDLLLDEGDVVVVFGVGELNLAAVALDGDEIVSAADTVFTLPLFLFAEELCDVGGEVAAVSGAGEGAVGDGQLAVGDAKDGLVQECAEDAVRQAEADGDVQHWKDEHEPGHAVALGAVEEHADAGRIPGDQEAIPENAENEEGPDAVVEPALGDDELGAPVIDLEAFGELDDLARGEGGG